jgi:hypothetical protein
VFYGRPDAKDIEDYQSELIEMLANQYVYSYEFGFKTNEKRLLTWHYTVGADGGLHSDADAGAIYPKATVAQASYFNFMTYSSRWAGLTAAQQEAFKDGLSISFRRTPGSGPVDGDGYWQTDHGYTAGGVRVERKTFRPR